MLGDHDSDTDGLASEQELRAATMRVIQTLRGMMGVDVLAVLLSAFVFLAKVLGVTREAALRAFDTVWEKPN